MTKLLAINNYYYPRGGAEAVFFEHNRLFEALHWQVVPFAMRHAKNLKSAWSDYFVDEIELGQSYSLPSKLARAGKVIYSFEARRKLERLLDEVRPDVCHAHNLYHHISPSVLGLLRARGIPTVMTLHDLKIACPAYQMLASDGICERCKGGRLHNVLVQRCIKGSFALSAVVMVESMLHRWLGSYRDCVSCFIAPSRFYVEKLEQWGFARTSLRHVPNFVVAERYTPEFSPGVEFVYFGRLSPEKGVATLIRAAANAACRLTIVGTGPQSDALRELAAEVGADATFLGYLTGEPLHTAIRRARAVVLPSEWYENAPMSVLESYALGKPVIGARIGGIPELVLEGRTGLTFDSGDPASLTAALRQIANMEDEDVRELGRAGREWVEREFTAALYRERVLEIYRGLGVPVPEVA